MICPKCGRSSKEVKFIEQFCVDCYPLTIRLDPIDIKLCTRCGKFLFKGKWGNYSLKNIVKSKIKGTYDDIELLENSVRVFYKGAVREYPVILKIEKTICPTCSRVAGGYYEAKIQVRGRNIEKTADRIVRALVKRTAITQIEELKEGLDIFVVDSKVVPEILRKLGYDFSMSKKLHTMIKGKRKYRTTFLVRR